MSATQRAVPAPTRSPVLISGSLAKTWRSALAVWPAGQRALPRMKGLGFRPLSRHMPRF